MKAHVVALLLFVLPGPCLAQANLFRLEPGDPRAGAVNRQPIEIAAQAEYPVEVDIRAVAERPKSIRVALPEGRHLVFEQHTFDPSVGFIADEQLDAVPDPNVPTDELVFRWYGLAKKNNAQLHLQVTKGIISATVIVPNKIYSIVGTERRSSRAAGGGEKRHILRESDPTRFPPDLPDNVGADDRKALPSDVPRQKYVDRISILVLHTPLVEAAIQNGDPNVNPLPTINARVDEVIGHLSQSFGNALVVPVGVFNVHESDTNRSEQINYPEVNGQVCPPTVPAPLCQFFGHRVFLRNDAFAQARRNATNADVVVMLVNDAAACGVAYTQRDNCGVDATFGSNEPGCTVGAGYNAFAYAVVNFGCSAAMQDFAHEAGHTFGMEHNPENIGAAPPPPSFPWSFGRFVFNQQETIMSIRGKFGTCGTCTKALQFSNPDVGFLNFPATASGTATQYNARTAAAFAPAMSEFRGPTLADVLFRSGMEHLPCTAAGADCH